MFETSAGTNHVDQLCGDWLDLSRQHGFPVAGERGAVLPDRHDAITRTVTAAIGFGLTTGYLTLTASYHIPASTCTASPNQDVAQSAPRDEVRNWPSG